MNESLKTSDRIADEALRAKSAALLDPSVLAAVLFQAPAMYVADERGRVILTTPKLDALLAPILADSSGPAARSPLIAEPLARLRAGEETVEDDRDIAGSGMIHSVHRRSRDSDGRLRFSGVFHADDASDTDTRERFLGKVHHDLRTPLNAIIGFAELSLADVEGRLRDRHRSYFEDIRHAAHELLARIERILAAVEAETVGSPAGGTDVVGVIAESAGPASDLARAKGVDLVLPEPGRIARAKADPAQLARIVDTVLREALTAAGPGGRIGVDLDDAPDGGLDLKVWDSDQGARLTLRLPPA